MDFSFLGSPEYQRYVVAPALCAYQLVADMVMAVKDLRYRLMERDFVVLDNLTRKPSNSFAFTRTPHSEAPLRSETRIGRDSMTPAPSLGRWLNLLEPRFASHGVCSAMELQR